MNSRQYVMHYFGANYRNQQEGFFIDVGAHNGVTLSNTLGLTKELSWSGICIEPHPDIFPQLCENRKGDICINAAVSSEEKDAVFYKISGHPEMLSGLHDCYDSRHIERIHREIAQYGGSIEEIVVKTKSLSQIIEEHQVKTIDYLSIDTEGSELNILQGINLDENWPKLISFEDNGYNAGCGAYLESKGYCHLGKYQYDRFFNKL